MAEGEMVQQNPKVAPVKKRRFFRPKPKMNSEEAAATDLKKQQKPKPAVKTQQNTKPKTEHAAKPKQASVQKAEQSAKPKQNAAVTKKAEPKVEQKVKPQNKPKQNAVTAQLNSKPKAEKTAVKTTRKAEKTNCNFKPRRQNSAPKLRLSDIDFKYLDTPEFADIYALVSKAQSYFAEDKETCCAKFRIANESIISRLIETLQLTEAAELNTFEQINLLSEKIPKNMVTENIFAEMHNIRMIGNSFVHNDDKYDPARGARTCLIATEKICRWLIEFEPKYKSYQRAKAATSSSFMESVANIFKGFVSIFKGK